MKTISSCRCFVFFLLLNTSNSHATKPYKIRNYNVCMTVAIIISWSEHTRFKTSRYAIVDKIFFEFPL
jgi:hypothetical protein